MPGAPLEERAARSGTQQSQPSSPRRVDPPLKAAVAACAAWPFERGLPAGVSTPSECRASGRGRPPPSGPLESWSGSPLNFRRTTAPGSGGVQRPWYHGRWHATGRARDERSDHGTPTPGPRTALISSPFLPPAPAPPAQARAPIEFSDARLKVEINVTDGDADPQIFLDGEAWTDVELIDPQGNAIVDVDVTGRTQDCGLTELFSESSEPPSKSSRSSSSRSWSLKARGRSGAPPSTECR
jgi:hypothetical protein